MTDRLDEIRIRLGISEISSGPMTCGYQDRQAREDIAYLLKEVGRLQQQVIDRDAAAKRAILDDAPGEVVEIVRRPRPPQGTN